MDYLESALAVWLKNVFNVPICSPGEMPRQISLIGELTKTTAYLDIIYSARRPTIHTIGQLLSQERLGTLPRATRVKNTILYGSKRFCWGLHFIFCHSHVMFYSTSSNTLFFLLSEVFLFSHSLLYPSKLQFPSI